VPENNWEQQARNFAGSREQEIRPKARTFWDTGTKGPEESTVSRCSGLGKLHDFGSIGAGEPVLLEKRIHWQPGRSVKRESQHEFRVVDG
jgi:hypothetical protein